MSLEAADDYLSSLTDLTINSKPLINMLTILAEENAEHAPAIVQAIEGHINKAPVPVKLPIMYLIDSIVKNVGPTYVPLFTPNIVNIFASVFEQVDEKTRSSLFKLRQTWNDIFPPVKMYALDTRIQHIDNNWPMLATPPMGIHVNPKFIKGTVNSSVEAGSSNEETVEARKQILLRLQQEKKELELQAAMLKEKQAAIVALQRKSEKSKIEPDKSGLRGSLAPKAVVIPPATDVAALPKKIAPVNMALIEAAKSRDPRLARLQKQKPVADDPSKQQEASEEAQRRDLLEMMKKKDPRTSGPPAQSALPEKLPEVKIKQDQIQSRKMAMLKAPVLGQLNMSSAQTRSKNHRSPEAKASRTRKGKTNSPKSEDGVKNNWLSPKYEEGAKDDRFSPKYEDSSKINSYSPMYEENMKVNKPSPKYEEGGKLSRNGPNFEKGEVRSKGGRNRKQKNNRNSRAVSRFEESSYEKRRDRRNRPDKVSEPRDPRINVSKLKQEQPAPVERPITPPPVKIERVEPPPPQERLRPLSPFTLQSASVERNPSPPPVDQRLQVPLFEMPPKPSAPIELIKPPPTKKENNVSESEPVKIARARTPPPALDFEPINSSPEPPPPPVIGHSAVVHCHAEEIDAEEESTTAPLRQAPQGFKDVKDAVKGRNYSRRNKERSPSPSPQPSDTDLRISLPNDVRLPTVDDKAATERDIVADEVVSVARDVDFRTLPGASSPSKKRHSTDTRAEGPPPKKGKSDDAERIQLFGNMDMDERMLPGRRLPTPPPPPLIAPSSPPSDSLVIDMEPPPPPTDLDVTEPPIAPETNLMPLSKQLELQAMEANQMKGEHPPTYVSPTQTMPGQRDKLGRLLLYNPLPNDPRARRESLGSQASQDSFTNEPLHISGIIANARVELHKGNMTQEAYNELVSRVVQMNEQRMVQAQRMDDRNRFRENQWSNDRDYRQRENMPPRRHRNDQDGPYNRRWRGEERGGYRNRWPDDRRRPNRSPIWGDEDSRSQERWSPPPRNLARIPPTNPDHLKAVNDDTVKKIRIDNVDRDIRFYGDVAVAIMSPSCAREIAFENGTRRVLFAGIEVTCTLNGPPIPVIVQNKTYMIRLGAPTREIYIDNNFLEVHFGNDPIGVILEGVHHEIAIEGPPPQVKIADRDSPHCLGKVRLIINAEDSCPIYLDGKPQKFRIDQGFLIIRFINAFETVLINEVEVDLKFGGMPVPILYKDTRYYLRLTDLPPHVVPGKVIVPNMENRKLAPLPEHIDNDPMERRRHAPVPEFMVDKPSDELERGMYMDVLSTTLDSNAEPEKAVGFDYKVGHPLPDMSVPPPVLKPQVEPSKPPEEPAKSLNVNDLLKSLVATGLIAKKEQQKKQHPAPLPKEMHIRKVDLNNIDSLRERQTGMIHMLYSGIQCGSCGVRFSPEETDKYSRHLDWHFRQNRRDRDAARRGSSRRWYYDVSDWIQFQEIEDLEERAQSWFETEAQNQTEDPMDVDQVASVPAPRGGIVVTCEICHDKFETFFHQDTEEWHLSQCMCNDEKYYHPSCYADSLQGPEALDVPSEPILAPPLLEVSVPEDKDDLKIEESIVVLEDDDKDDGEIEVVTVDEKEVAAVVNSLIDRIIAEEECDLRGPLEDDELEVLAVTNKEENKPPVDVIDVTEGGDVYFPPEPVEFDPNMKIKEEPMDEMESPLAQVDQTIATVVSSIDGNVEMVEAPVAPVAPVSKIKITFNKPVTIEPKEKPIELPEDPNDLQIEEIEPSPLPFRAKKPKLAERELTVYPPIVRDSELSGLCSIM